ncbi:MAG: hypothetical protein BWY47_00434 [Bacteroidetes bacterium ADurb.Bin302]|nr:MAG: hypothetical protein BWY47_00434 [Bacteroidetes bacterium ADurb.Bin302]
MFKCEICQKTEVKDKGKGFRVFIKYNVLMIMGIKGENIPSFGNCTRQVRICEKCLKKDFKTIEI